MNAEFENILKEILKENWDLKTWSAHESGDWFQTKHFCGGFEADETYENGEFNFSYYDEHEKEWWFTFKLHEVNDLFKKGFNAIQLTDPDTFDYNEFYKNNT